MLRLYTYPSNHFSQDGEFLAIMSTYVNEGLVKDTSAVTSGEENMDHLRTLLAVAAKALNK